jgi:NTE family protein
MNSIFIDALDQDAVTLERVNRLAKELPPQKRHGMRPVDLLQLRPSVHLGRLAHEYESEIPTAFRFLTTGLGTRETESPDWLSVLLFEPAYIDRLLDIGYHDARRQHDCIARFLTDGEDTQATRSVSENWALGTGERAEESSD